MTVIDFAEILPRVGTISISGGRFEEDLIGAIARINAEGGDLRIIPLSPMQTQWAMDLGIPTARGYPTYFILQSECRGNDYLLQSQTTSVFADRIMGKMAEHVWAVVTADEKKILVEAASQFLDYTVDELSLHGKIEGQKENYMGHILVSLVPEEDDFFHLPHILRDVPGVIDVGVYLEPPEKIIVIK